LHVCFDPEYDEDEETGEEYCVACERITKRGERYEELDLTDPLPPCPVHNTPRRRSPYLGLPFCDECDKPY
jgi:hypothetical protein